LCVMKKSYYNQILLIPFCLPSSHLMFIFHTILNVITPSVRLDPSVSISVSGRPTREKVLESPKLVRCGVQYKFMYSWDSPPKRLSCKNVSQECISSSHAH
jgi:hypothetical protein